MAVSDLNDWLGECLASGTIWYLKRFAANDTLANHSHQAGPYIPKDLLFELFPAIAHSGHCCHPVRPLLPPHRSEATRGWV